jgi:cytochrome c biogenesis protein
MTVDEDWTVTQDRAPSPLPPRSGISPYRWIVTVARRSWRGLTSMRTALILLFLLAIAAIPGSLLPQKNLNLEKVQTYYRNYPSLAPVLDKAGFFSVFSSVWFSAIYLLLFISLVGCLLPRLRAHWTGVRRVPPDAPARLSRMPLSASDLRFAEPPEVAAGKIRDLLRARRYRTVVRRHDDGTVTVSAEKGYLKETGNLLFHFSLVALLIGVAFGSWYGWHASRLLVAGPDTAFCNTLTQYDEYGLGARVNDTSLAPFCVQLNSFKATYLSSGQPTEYTAQVAYTTGSSSSWTAKTLRVNDPLRLPHANVYLLGHGYAPIIKYTDKYGVSQTRVAPFLATDGLLTSAGVAAFPDANIDPKTGSNQDPKTFVRQQVAFAGVYLPTIDEAGGATSVFPAENDPMLVLTPYVGDIGLDNGTPQSVYTLNQSQIAAGKLRQLEDPVRLRPGQSTKLSDGTTVQFVGTRQFVTLSVRYDPGEKIVLVGAILLVLGLLLSLTGRRRRVWFRLSPDPSSSAPSSSAASSSVSGSDASSPGASGPGASATAAGGSVGEAGGLARAEYASFPVEFESITKSTGGV